MSKTWKTHPRPTSARVHANAKWVKTAPLSIRHENLSYVGWCENEDYADKFNNSSVP